MQRFIMAKAVFAELVEQRANLEVAYHEEGRCSAEHFAQHHPALKRACDKADAEITDAMLAYVDVRLSEA